MLAPSQCNGLQRPATHDVKCSLEMLRIQLLQGLRPAMVKKFRLGFRSSDFEVYGVGLFVFFITHGLAGVEVSHCKIRASALGFEKGKARLVLTR